MKKATELISEVRNPEVEAVQDPRFYVEDASMPPKGDWRIILVDANFD